MDELIHTDIRVIGGGRGEISVDARADQIADIQIRIGCL